MQAIKKIVAKKNSSRLRVTGISDVPDSVHDPAPYMTRLSQSSSREMIPQQEVVSNRGYQTCAVKSSTAAAAAQDELLGHGVN